MTQKIIFRILQAFYILLAGLGFALMVWGGVNYFNPVIILGCTMFIMGFVGLGVVAD